MAKAILDTIANSSLNYSENEPSEKVRGGLVTEISGDPATAFDQCLTADGMPSLGDSIVVNGKTLYYRRLIVRPTDAGDTATVQLVYDNNISGQNSALIIDFHSYEQEYESNRIPGTREPILIPDWFPKGGQAGNFQMMPIKGDLAMVRFAYPMRQVSVSGIQQGKMPPPGTYDANAGGVNDKDFLGLPAGWWRFQDGDQKASVYNGYFQFSASAVTKNIEDWSRYEILYSQKYGIFAKVDPDDDKTLHQAKYKHGIMASVPGCIRIGPYPTLDFDSLFTKLPQAAQHPFQTLLHL